jgi:hypothetical protein
LRIFSRKFAPGGGGFHRTGPNGNRLAPIWEFRAKSDVTHCLFQQSVSHRASSIDAQIAGVIFLAFGRSDALWHAWRVAGHTAAVTSMRGFN